MLSVSFVDLLFALRQYEQCYVLVWCSELPWQSVYDWELVFYVSILTAMLQLGWLIFVLWFPCIFELLSIWWQDVALSRKCKLAPLSLSRDSGIEPLLRAISGLAFVFMVFFLDLLIDCSFRFDFVWTLSLLLFCFDRLLVALIFGWIKSLFRCTSFVRLCSSLVSRINGSFFLACWWLRFLIGFPGLETELGVCSLKP